MGGLSEAVVRALLDRAPDPLVAVDADGSVLFASAEVERLLGWTDSELSGEHLSRLLPQWSPTVAEPVSDAVRRDMVARRRDGSEFPAEVTSRVFETHDGAVTALVVHDATAATRAERRFEAVLAAAPDGIVAVTADGTIELVNAQAEQLFGWSSRELVGQPIEVLVPEEARGRHLDHRRDYLDDLRLRPMGAGVALAGRRRDGTQFPAEISLSAVEEAGGTLVITAVRDISERLRVEEDRRERSQAAQREQWQRLESLGQLAGGVAHDFNNLLGVIMNYATLAARAVEDEHVVEDLDQIRAAAERGAALTRQLLTFARRDAAAVEPVPLDEVVNEVGVMLSRTIGEQIDLALRLADGPLVVQVDRFEIEQVLLNLAINARDAMPAGGVLRIEARRRAASRDSPEDEVVLTVRDTGMGMTPEVASRAFEPFYTTKGRGDGTGLGLATVYGIVRRGGGTVDLHSAVGVGTTVTIAFPAYGGAVAAPGPGPDVPRGGTERVLLVEDESSLAAGTARLLRAHGYDVVVRQDGVRALAWLDAEGNDTDLVLTDVAMPHGRGDELGEILARSHPRLPLVFMSGYDAELPPGAGRLLTKPVTQETLLRTIREVLDA